MISQIGGHMMNFFLLYVPRYRIAGWLVDIVIVQRGQHIVVRISAPPSDDIENVY